MTDINRRMMEWKQATGHPERASEFLKAYPLNEFNNRSDIAQDRAKEIAYRKKDPVYNENRFPYPEYKDLTLEKYFDLVAESGAKDQDEFVDYLFKKLRDKDPETAIEAYKNMQRAREVDDMINTRTGLEYSAPRGGDFAYTGSDDSSYGPSGKKYLLMNKPGARTQRRKFAVDPLKLADKGAHAARRAGAAEATDTINRIKDAKSHDEPIDTKKRYEQNKGLTYPPWWKIEDERRLRRPRASEPDMESPQI